MSDLPKCCGNCRFARWQRLTPTGRISKDTVGKCLVVPVVDRATLPDCVSIGTHRLWVEECDGKHCHAYAERNENPQLWDGNPVASYEVRGP